MMPSTIAALYEHFFVSHRPIVKPDDFRPVLENVLGKELAAKVAEQSGDLGKKILTENSDQVVREGAFGLPWFVGEYSRFKALLVSIEVFADQAAATNAKGRTEAYWGFDHIGQVIDHLGLEKPRTGGWRAML